MASKQQTIARKIKKLLSLAGNNPSEEEAQAALLKAQEMCLSAGLSMEEIKAEGQDSKPRKVTVDDVILDENSGQVTNWQIRLVGIVAKNFRCTHLIHTHFTGKTATRGKTCRTFRLIGEKMDVTACRLSLEFLFKAFGYLWQEYRGGIQTKSRSETMAKKEAYSIGFADGLRKKFAKQVKEMALIVVQDQAVGNYINTNFQLGHERRTHESGNGAPFDITAYATGLKDGQSVEKDKMLQGAK